MRQRPASATVLSILGLAAAILAPPLATQGPPPRKKVAILLFDQVQTIDYAAPLEVLAGPFEVFTVAPTREPVRTVHGQRITPDHSIADAPAAEILVVPGGGGRRPEAKTPLEMGAPFAGHDDVIAWLRARAATAEIVLSVCNGAFTLARAGLLDGLEATTTASLIPVLAQAVPSARVRDDRRFVDNGKVITAGGLSAGIDAALHVIERVHGRGMAQMAALGIEYPWDPEGGWSRAALADRYLRFRFDGIPPAAGWTMLSREGDRDRWTHRWRVAFGADAAELRRHLDRTLLENVTWGPPTTVRWLRDGDAPPAEASESRWTFSDEKGGRWHGRLSVDAAPGAPAGTFEATLAIERAPASVASGAA